MLPYPFNKGDFKEIKKPPLLKGGGQTPVVEGFNRLVSIHEKKSRVRPGTFYYSSSSSTSQQKKNESIRKIEEYRIKSLRSFLSSAIFGNAKMFKARWLLEYALTDPDYFEPTKWTYLYDHSPLATTLEKYIDYEKLSLLEIQIHD
jgi:hypothetical protein